MGLIDDLKSWSRRQGAPVTIALMATMIATNLYFWLMRAKGIDTIAFLPNEVGRVWTFVTYPWAYLIIAGWEIVFFVFLMYWLWWIGGFVEREIGSARYALWWFVWTILGAVCIWGGSIAMKTGRPLLGPEIPISALTIAWCTRNPSSQVLLGAILPITGKWLGWLTLACVFFGFGYPVPLLGVCASVPLVTAYLYASNRLPFMQFEKGAVSSRQRTMEKEATTRGQVRYDDAYFDDVKRREQEREERERLRKLFGDES